MPQGIGIRQRAALFHDLGVMEYGRALDLQIRTRSGKMENPELPDRVFFVQHPPVFTFGKWGGRENLMVSQEFLEQEGVAVFQTDRGGNITYHGPGQAVLYPVVDLERARIGVADFVFGLEEIMKQTAADYGITADRDERNHGLWVPYSKKGAAKIGSVGLSVKKGISIHGLAMNISPDMTPFTWINPCGMANVAMTSMAKEMEGSDALPIPMDHIREKFADYFCDRFNFEFIEEE